MPDVEHLFIKVDVILRQGQQLTDAQPCPEQDFQTDAARHLLHILDECLELFNCPELHLRRVILANAPGLFHGVAGQVIVFHGVIEDRGKLVIDGFLVCLGASFLDDLRLPLPDLGRGNLVYLTILERGQQL